MPRDLSKAVQRRMLTWTPELVAKFWDNLSHSRLHEWNFAKTAGRNFIIAVDHLLLRDGRATLDFGAGQGELLALLIERGCKVMAYEPSAGRTRTLEEKMAGNPGFLGLIDEKSDQKFDCVIMTEVIEHVLDEEFDATLSRVASLTAKDGLVIVTTPLDEDMELNFIYCPVSDLWYHRWQHVRTFTLETLATTMARFGFEEVVSHRMDFSDQYFIPFDPMWGGADPEEKLPPHLRALRQNSPAYCGGQKNILYVGRKL